MEPPEDKSPWGLIFILFGAGILSAFQIGKVPPVLSDIRSELTLSLYLAGWLLSLFNVTGLMLGTFTGAIADAVGHRRLMLAGFILQIIGALLGSLARSYTGLVFTRFLEGSGFIAVIISTPTLIFQIVRPRDLKAALSIWTCYLPIGASLMMVLLPLVLTLTDWRGLWRINAGILLVYALIVFQATSRLKLPKPSSQCRVTDLLRDVITTSISPVPLILALIFITYSLQWLTVLGFLPTLIIEKFGFPPSRASFLTAGMVFVNIFGNLYAGKRLKAGADRFRLVALAALIMGLSAVVIYTDINCFMINYAGCLVFSVAGGLIPASILGAVPLYAPSGRLIATTNGLVIQGGQLGQVIGPPIMAFLVSRTGSWTCGAWFLGGVALLCMTLSLWIGRMQPPVTDFRNQEGFSPGS